MGSQRQIDSVLGFDGTHIRFEGGYEISIDIGQVVPDARAPHGYRYSFVLRRPNADGTPGKRILGYDNAHAPTGVIDPFDHVHKTKTGPGGSPIGVREGAPMKVESVNELIGRFMGECYVCLRDLGVDVDAAQLTVKARGRHQPK